ncbi:MAG: hypothetical protein ACLFPR_05440, partial [Desulfococcaceae bacterium]
MKKTSFLPLKNEMSGSGRIDGEDKDRRSGCPLATLRPSVRAAGAPAGGISRGTARWGWPGILGIPEIKQSSGWLG